MQNIEYNSVKEECVVNTNDIYEQKMNEYSNNLYRKNMLLNRRALSHKKFVYTSITIITILGAIVPFAAQFILPFFFPNSNIAGIEIWNQYVSIILGVIATLMSIISLKLSFDNVEQSYETELSTQQLLFDLKLHLNNIENNQGNYLTKTDIMSLLKNGYYFGKENDIDSKWNKPSSISKKESKDI